MDTPSLRRARTALAALAALAAASAASAQVQSFDFGPGTASAAAGMPDGGYVVAGSRAGAGASAGRSVGLIFKMQPDGQVEWAMTLEDRDPAAWQPDLYLTAVTPTSTGFAVVGEHRDMPSQRGLVASFDFDGTLLWQRLLPTTLRASILEAPDGTLVVGHARGPGDTQFVAFVEPDGSAVRTVSLETFTTISSIAPPGMTPAGTGVLFAGPFSPQPRVIGTRLFEMDGSGSIRGLLEGYSFCLQAHLATDPAGTILLGLREEYTSRFFQLGPGGDALGEIVVSPSPGVVESLVAWPQGGWLIVGAPWGGGDMRTIVQLDELGAVVRADDLVMQGHDGAIQAATGRDGVLLVGAGGTRIVAAHVGATGLTPSPCIDVAPRVLGTSVASPPAGAPTTLSPQFPATSLSQSLHVTTPVTLASQCSSCTPLDCSPITRISSGAPCAEEEAEFGLSTVGGGGIVTVSWDLDGDGIADATGRTVRVPPGPSPLTLTAWATDECATGAQTCTMTETFDRPSMPGEVSDVVAGAPPLLVAKAPADSTMVTTERVPGAWTYNAHVGTIGSFDAPTISICDAEWPGPGPEIRIGGPFPAGSWWVVVTASNSCGEGSTGSDSLGRERDEQPSWTGCAP